METLRPRSPRVLHRSRSIATSRSYHVPSTTATNSSSAPPEKAPPFSANLSRTSSLPRTKSTSKAPSTTTTTAAATTESATTTAAICRKPKENCCQPCPRPTHSPRLPLPSSSAAAKRVAKVGPSAPAPSAWALSPGRSPKAAEVGPAVAPRKAAAAGGGRGGVLGLFRRKKEPSAKEETAHQLKMLTSRLLQWRFANARAEAAMAAAKASAEKRLFYAWLKINELRNLAAAKRIVIQRRKQKMKLARILHPHTQLLVQWEPHARRHLEAVALLARALGAQCLAVPLIDGAQANLVLVNRYMSKAVDIMIEIEAAVSVFYFKADNICLILRELEKTSRLEKQGLDELIEMYQRIITLEMHEISLRANLIQALKEKEGFISHRHHQRVIGANGVCINKNQVTAGNTWNSFLTPKIYRSKLLRHTTEG